MPELLLSRGYAAHRTVVKKRTSELIRSVFPLRPPLRLRSQWVFGPSVLGVAAAEVLAHFSIGGSPEAGQISGDLLRPHVGGQEVQQDRHAPTGDARRL